MDQCLQESIDFNERINNQELWNKKLREKQQSEMKDLQLIRDKIKARMLYKEAANRFRSRTQLSSYKIDSEKEKIFSENKLSALLIF